MKGATVAARAVELDVDEAKRLATARARVALWGGTLTLIEGDDGRREFIVTRWCLTRSFDDLAHVERFLTEAGVR